MGILDALIANREVLEAIIYIGTLVGAIPAAIVFLYNQRVQARETMLARYDAMNRSYIEYQQLCLTYPELGTSAYETDGPSAPLDPIGVLRKNISFDIMTSLFERAYLTYLDAPLKIRRSQWPGWRAFIGSFAGREDYADWWRENVVDFTRRGAPPGQSQYDLRFERFMHELLVKQLKSESKR